MAKQKKTGPPLLPDSNDVLASNDIVTMQAHISDRRVAQMPFNSNKALEYGNADGMQHAPSAGEAALSQQSADHARPPGTSVRPVPILPPPRGLTTVADGGHLTTDQGVPISDNQHSLKAGLRGPSLLEDFILREKLTHFDHERIPERVVHARGSAAHGYFEAYDPLGQYTRAAPFAAKGKITPVFVRFSTVAGERGSKDTARDARGFAVKFYTDEGNWDLVGNNIPVFFIQDAMKFPDLVHAVKPEPHHGMPQAASAHDTFWDFVSLMPESTHMLLWVMSGRGLPRSYRMMQGFGVHTFRLVNQDGQSIFCKFHWKPLLGTHALLWDEAVKISGADPDFHRRDLWEAIESGEFPEWELGLQLFTEQQANDFSFDVLDATKLIPEELVPLLPVGRMVLNRNPDNFFAETEQVAFCTAHLIPGIDFSNDPLLAGRIHSYIDTQITRLGGANFHEIPVNAPLTAVQNNQRDGIHRQTINRGQVAYEPNSLAGGCPFQTGIFQTDHVQAHQVQPGNQAEIVGYSSVPEHISADKVRGKPARFAEHYLQARLFFYSQNEAEQLHITEAFRFELSKVTVPAIRQRMLSSLVNVSVELAAAVAAGLGMAVPAAMPKATEMMIVPELTFSAALSLQALPGECGIRTRQIAVLVEDGVHQASLMTLYDALIKAGAVVHFVGPRIGLFVSSSGDHLAANKSMENSPAVLFDALILPDGTDAVRALLHPAHTKAQTIAFIQDIYWHGKTMLVLGAGQQLLAQAGIPVNLPADPGILLAKSTDVASITAAFIAAIQQRTPR